MSEYLYLPSSPTTVFSGVDYRGNTLALNPGAADTPVYLNGVKLLLGLDYSITSSSVTMLLGSVGPPNTVEIVTGQSAASGTFVESTGSTVTLAASVPVNMTSLALPAGDWTVNGSVYFDFGTALVTTIMVGASTASAALPSRFYYSQSSPGGVTGGSWGISIPTQRLNVTVPTTAYLVAQAGFGPGSTVTGAGHLQARAS